MERLERTPLREPLQKTPLLLHAEPSLYRHPRAGWLIVAALTGGAAVHMFARHNTSVAVTAFDAGGFVDDGATPTSHEQRFAIAAAGATAARGVTAVERQLVSGWRVALGGVTEEYTAVSDDDTLPKDLLVTSDAANQTTLLYNDHALENYSVSVTGIYSELGNGPDFTLFARVSGRVTTSGTDYSVISAMEHGDNHDDDATASSFVDGYGCRMDIPTPASASNVSIWSNLNLLRNNDSHAFGTSFYYNCNHDDSSHCVMNDTAFDLYASAWYNLTLSVRGAEVSCDLWTEGQHTSLNATDGDPYPAGSAGVGFNQAASPVQFVRPHAIVTPL